MRERFLDEVRNPRNVGRGTDMNGNWRSRNLVPTASLPCHLRFHLRDERRVRSVNEETIRTGTRRGRHWKHPWGPRKEGDRTSGQEPDPESTSDTDLKSVSPLSEDFFSEDFYSDVEVLYL